MARHARLRTRASPPPKSFEVDVVGESMSKQIDQTNIIYSATAIKDPDRWAVAVSARDDSQLAKRHLKVDGREVSIRAMPDDQVWGTFVESRVSKGLPKLHDLLGLPWSNLSLLVITETVTPYLYGYAGWYTPNDNTIEVGDELDAQVILHELSHIWFNDTLFSARWIDEGFAQDYGSRAVAQLGERLDTPQPVDTRARGAVALDSWSSVNLQDENSDARERFGYNASWFVLRKLTAEIGITRMQRVLEAASTNELPYAGHQSQSGGSEAVTTRRFLDYLEEIGGSKVAEDLFSKYVMTADGRKNLVKRRQARESYKKLVTASGRWDTPLTIRSDMSDWSFTTALRHIEIATAVTAARDEIDRTLRPLGLRTPLRLQVDYENGSGELGALKVRALAAVETAKELVRAESAVKESHGIFATVGLIGATHERDLARARTSFKDGDAEQARTWALAAEQTVADASGAGIQRVGAAVGLVVLLVLLGWGVRTWRRRRARRAAERAAAAALLADTELDPEPGTDPDAQNEPVTPWPSG